jgi:ribokinase
MAHFLGVLLQCFIIYADNLRRFTMRREYLANFKTLGVDTSRVGVEENVETAVATVTVDDEGENRIILIKGANWQVTPDYLHGVRQTIRDCKVVVCQNEIPCKYV